MDKNSLEKTSEENLVKLQNNNYPGRGIVLGLNKAGNFAVQIYWLMGRSNNSRNRVFVKSDNIIKTKAYDESKLEDPSLIIYNAMVSVGKNHVVTNGDQTDTIKDALDNKKDIKNAIKTRTFEPDAPNFTPRISGITTLLRKGFKNFFSVIYRGNNGKPIYYFSETKPDKGFGLCLHTYERDGNPLPSFKRPPYTVPIQENIEDIADEYWAIINQENKVALVVKTISRDGEINYVVKNKFT